MYFLRNEMKIRLPDSVGLEHSTLCNCKLQPMWSIIHFFVLLSAEPVVIINETIRMKRGCSWVMQWPEMNADLLISFRTKGSNMNYGRNFTFPTLAHLPICAQPHIIHIQAWHTSSTKLDNVLKEHSYSLDSTRDPFH